MENQNNLLFQASKSREKLYLDLFGKQKYCLPKNYLSSFKDIEVQESHEIDEIAQRLGQSITEKDIAIFAYKEEQENYPENNSIISNTNIWKFVSFGLSNPWFIVDNGLLGKSHEEIDESNSIEASGFGCELLLKTTEPKLWCLKLLRRLNYYITSYTGTLSPGIMLRFDKKLTNNTDSNLAGIIIWYADEAPDCIYQLPSGAFGIFSVIGITHEECDLIENIGEYGCWSVQQLIRSCGYGQVTIPTRPSVTSDPQFMSKLNSLQNYLTNFSFK